MHTGVPAKPAANVAKLLAGFVPQFSMLEFVVALVATLAWAWLVKWRAGRHREALWKSMVLPAGGAALCWLLLTTLWLPVIDYARSYTPVVRGVQNLMQPAGGCAEVFGLDRGQLAALRFHADLELQPALTSPSCPWLVVAQDARPVLPAVLDATRWEFVGTVRRPRDANDNLHLYRRRR